VGNYPFVATIGGIVPPLPVADGGTGQITAAAAFAGLAPLTTEGDLLYENATPAPARLAIGAANQVLGISGSLPAWVAAFYQLATTGNSGVALINGTQTILTWTAPSDGNLHIVCWALLQHVTSNETNGAVVTTITGKYTVGNGFAGGSTTGWYQSGGSACLNAGDTFQVNQSTALTGGAATVYGLLWGE